MGEEQRIREQQLPNQFYVRAEVTRASYRARAGGSRNQGAGPEGRQGTFRMRRRYFLDARDLVKSVRAAKRRGADVEADLRGFGTVFAGRRDSLVAYTADEAIRLAFPRCDISPPHLKDRRATAGTGQETGEVECSGSCHETSGDGYGKPLEGAAVTWSEPAKRTQGESPRATGN